MHTPNPRPGPAGGSARRRVTLLAGALALLVGLVGLVDPAGLAGPATAATRPAGPGAGTIPDPSTKEQFEIARFDRNLRDALDRAGHVGYAYAIGLGGRLYHQVGVGQARTAADAPATPQSPTKPMTVASISKPITAVAVLRLLEQEGISVQDSIEPWLPETWQRGAGIEDISFEDLMTHRSGLRQSYEAATGKNGITTSSYPNMRIAVAQDVGDTSYRYANMNFGIFRLIVPKIFGYDYSPQYDNPPPGVLPDYFAELIGTIFDSYVTELLGSVGVAGGCVNWDPDPPTILYKNPDTGQSGWQTGSHLLGCGGYGFYLSASGLTGFLSALRYTDQLLSPSAREQMYERRLGLKKYAGAHGDYFGHGGVWGSGGRGMHGCVMTFHIHVDVSLLVNNPRGEGPYACTVLRTAFDSAWTP